MPLTTALNRPLSEVQTLASVPGAPVVNQLYMTPTGIYIFLKGITSGALGSWVTYDELGITALLAANAVGPVAVLLGAADAATKGVWACVFGSCSAKVSTGFADNGNLYATATAGEADDAVVAGDRIKNAIGRSAISGGLATVQLWWPFMDDALAA